MGAEDSDKESPLNHCAEVEGWVQVLACGDIHATSARCELDDDNISQDGRKSLDIGEESIADSLADGRMWATICCDFLFLSAGETRAPHALLDLRKMRVADIDVQTFMITLELAEAHASQQVILVLLLPDGRFRASYLPRFQMKFSTLEALQCWQELIALARMDVPLPPA